MRNFDSWSAEHIDNCISYTKRLLSGLNEWYDMLGRHIMEPQETQNDRVAFVKFMRDTEKKLEEINRDLYRADQNFITAVESGIKPSYAYEGTKLRTRKSMTVNESSSHNYKKWTSIFQDMIDTLGVSVSWDPNKKKYYLEDLQGTLSFYGDYFKKATQVVERLYGLVEDYVAQDLDEESKKYGLIEFDEFNITDPRFLDNWCTWYEDFDIDANDPDYIELGRKFIKDHEAEFKWADLMCNHADDVDLSYLKK